MKKKSLVLIYHLCSFLFTKRNKRFGDGLQNKGGQNKLPSAIIKSLEVPHRDFWNEWKKNGFSVNCKENSTRNSTSKATEKGRFFKCNSESYFARKMTESSRTKDSEQASVAQLAHVPPAASDLRGRLKSWLLCFRSSFLSVTCKSSPRQPTPLGSSHPHGDHAELLGPALWPGPEFTVTAIWGLN